MRVIRRLRSETGLAENPAPQAAAPVAAPAAPVAQGARKRVLNCGSGPATLKKLHPSFSETNWQEVRLDIDARVKPDLIGSIVDMHSIIGDNAFDAVWSSHNIEHLYAHEVLPALREFYRVLRPTGYVLVTCPDIASIAKLALEKGIDHQAYVSPAGPITVMDMMFGFSPSIAQGNYYMAHHTGFTAERLGRCMLDAGFDEVRVVEGRSFDIWALAFKPEADRAEIERSLTSTNEARLFS